MVLTVRTEATLGKGKKNCGVVYHSKRGIFQMLADDWSIRLVSSLKVNIV